MITKHSIQNQLRQGGYQESDINLGSLLSKRALESYHNLGIGIRACRECCEMGDYQLTPLTGIGPISAPIMIVSSVPGIEDEKTCVPFIGVHGQLLALILSKAGVDRNAVYMTYAMKIPVDYEPKPSQLQHVRKHFLQEIEAINPAVILTFGNAAMRMSRDKYDLRMRDARGNVDTVEYEVMGFKKQAKLINTYDLNNILEPSDNLDAFKNAVWNDLKKAVDTAKQLRPDYKYDRVGLEELKK